MSQFTRRQFLKTALGAFVVGLTLPFQSRAAKASPRKVSETEPLAQSLGYKADATKIDPKKYPQRSTPEGKKQFCDGCVFYSGAQGAKEGPCQLFGNDLVAAKGWCSSWAPKPKV